MSSNPVSHQVFRFLIVICALFIFMFGLRYLQSEHVPTEREYMLLTQLGQVQGGDLLCIDQGIIPFFCVIISDENKQPDRILGHTIDIPREVGFSYDEVIRYVGNGELIIIPKDKRDFTIQAMMNVAKRVAHE